MLWYIVCLVLPTLVVSLEKPEDVSAEMYCIGCEIVLKELHSMLIRKPTRGMGETVSRALKQVCHENHFKKYDVGYKTSVKVCKHIKDDDGMETILVREYSRLHEFGLDQSSYLTVSKKVCGLHLGACTYAELVEPGEDGGIAYDPDTQTFNIKDGKKVKTTNPVKAKTTNRTPVLETVDTLETVEPMPVPVQSTDKHDEL